ncbi:hypothetical protein BKA56DRAFT_567133, partial [Ilyonectria sp. MPI-CAGE-AT-0026]
MGVWGRLFLVLFVLEHRGQLPPAWLRGWWWEWWFWWWLVGTAEATSIEASGRMTGGQGLFLFFSFLFRTVPVKNEKAARQWYGRRRTEGGRGGRMWACRWSSVVAASGAPTQWRHHFARI